MGLKSLQNALWKLLFKMLTDDNLSLCDKRHGVGSNRKLYGKSKDVSVWTSTMHLKKLLLYCQFVVSTVNDMVVVGIHRSS